MDMDTKDIVMAVVIVIAIIGLVGVSIYGSYMRNKLRVENFENTIKDLSPEQKCLHICGFEFHNHRENYKFCIEKCDRISERSVN